MSVFVRNPFNYSMDEVSSETALVCDDVSLTKQQFKDESDINEIVRRFNLTGQLPDNVSVPQYADFSEVVDFQGAQNIIRAAIESFMEMPVKIREYFSNDPGRFVDFVNDDSNRAEAEKLGLVVKKSVDNLAVSVTIPPAANPAASNGGDNNGNS